MRLHPQAHWRAEALPIVQLKYELPNALMGKPADQPAENAMLSQRAAKLILHVPEQLAFRFYRSAVSIRLTDGNNDPSTMFERIGQILEGGLFIEGDEERAIVGFRNVSIPGWEDDLTGLCVHEHSDT